MPEFGSPFSGLANGRKLADEERVHAGEFLRLLHELAPDEETFYAKGAAEVEAAMKRYYVKKTFMYVARP